MKLAIADPPYLGRAQIWYSDKMRPSQMGHNHGGRANITGPQPADHHPQAHIWDDPQTHAALVNRLVTDYDGFAIAMAHDNLRTYFAWLPRDVRIGIWGRTNVMPGGARVINAWEPVAVRIPATRRTSKGASLFPLDILNANVNRSGFPGSKPRAWTRWVLDMMGYDEDTDTVDDLFTGSGAVTAELSQLTLRLQP